VLETNKVAISTTVVSLLIGSGLGTEEEGDMIQITTNISYIHIRKYEQLASSVKFNSYYKHLKIVF